MLPQIGHIDRKIFLNNSNINRNYSGAEVEPINNVSFAKRLLALILDVSSLIVTFIFSLIYLFTSLEWIVDNGLYLLVILQLPYMFFDQVYLPNKTGYTIMRYVLGYKILNIDGSLISKRKLIVRSLFLLFLEYVITSLISLVLVLFRKDNRSLHELVTYTTAIHVRKIRIAPFLMIFILLYFVFLCAINSFCNFTDNWRVKPVLNELTKNELSVVISDSAVFLDSLGNKYNDLKEFERALDKAYVNEFVIDQFVEKIYSLGLFENDITQEKILRKVYCGDGLILEDPFPLFRPIESINRSMFRILFITNVLTHNVRRNYLYGCSEERLFIFNELVDSKNKVFIVYEILNDDSVYAKIELQE